MLFCFFLFRIISITLFRKTGLSLRKNKYLKTSNSNEKAQFEDGEELTTVNAWFESSDEENDKSQQQQLRSQPSSSRNLKLEPSKHRKSLLANNSSNQLTSGNRKKSISTAPSTDSDTKTPLKQRKKSIAVHQDSPSTLNEAQPQIEEASFVEDGSYSQEMELVDSTISEDRIQVRPIVVHSPQPQPYQQRFNRQEYDDSASRTSNKENDVERGDISPLAARRSSVGTVLQDITGELAEFDDSVAADEPDVNEDSLIDNDDLPSHHEIEGDEEDNASLAISHISKQSSEPRRSLSLKDEPRISIGVEGDQNDIDADYGDEDAVEPDMNGFDEEAEILADEIKPVKPKKNKSILKKTNYRPVNTGVSSELPADSKLPRDLARRNMPVKLFEKGGLKEVETEEGIVKRSSRMKYAPLEYWRNEKVKFGRRKSGLFPVPVIQEIIRVPDQDEDGQRRKKGKSHSSAAKYTVPESVEFVATDGRPADAPLIISSDAKIAFKSVQNESYKIAKLLVDPENKGLFSGFLLLPPHGEKSVSDSGVLTILGYVISGEIELTIHETTVVLARGASFVIPKYNQYRIANPTNRDTKCFIVNQR